MNIPIRMRPKTSQCSTELLILLIAAVSRAWTQNIVAMGSLSVSEDTIYVEVSARDTDAVAFGDPVTCTDVSTVSACSGSVTLTEVDGTAGSPGAPGDPFKFTASGLSPASAYTFMFPNEGEFEFPMGMYGVTLCTKPEKVQTVSAESSSTSSCKVTWASPEADATTQIEVLLGDVLQTKITDSGVTEYEITGLSLGTEYTIKVRTTHVDENCEAIMQELAEAGVTYDTEEVTCTPSEKTEKTGTGTAGSGNGGNKEGVPLGFGAVALSLMFAVVHRMSFSG